MGIAIDIFLKETKLLPTDEMDIELNQTNMKQNKQIILVITILVVIFGERDKLFIALFSWKKIKLNVACCTID